jgi:hypothetical protein
MPKKSFEDKYSDIAYWAYYDFRAEMIAALLKDAEDPEYSEEVAVWDSVVGDGIDATESLH